MLTVANPHKVRISAVMVAPLTVRVVAVAWMTALAHPDLPGARWAVTQLDLDRVALESIGAW